MVAYDSVSQNLKLLDFAKRRPIRGAHVSLSVGTIRGKQDVCDAAARLGLGTNSQLMQTNFKQFSVCKLDAHSLAYVSIVQTARVHWHWQSRLSSAQHAAPVQRKDIKTAGNMPALQNLLDRENVVERTDVYEMAGYGGRCGHNRADELVADGFPLAAFQLRIPASGVVRSVR